MAEETINSLVACKKSESDGSSSGKTSIRKPNSADNGCGVLPHSTRKSTDSCHDFNNSRRNSTGEPILQKSNQKIVPHYLRASTGSCHDFCKYGRKHAFEGKERRPFLKRIMRTSSDKQNPAVTLSLGERTKPIVRKKMISPDMTSHSLKHGASPGAINLADPPEIIKQEVLLPSKAEVSSECDPLSHNKSKAEKRVNNFSNKHSPSVRPPPTKKSSPVKQSSDKQNIAVTLSLGLRKKATVFNQIISSDMTSPSLKHGASPGAINSTDPATIIKQEVLMPTKKVEVSPKCDPVSHKLKSEKRRNNFSNNRSPSVQTSPTKQSFSFQTLKSAKKVEKAEKTSKLSLKCSPSLGPQPPTKKVEKNEKMMNNLSQKCSPSAGPRRAVSKLSSLFRTPQNTNGRVKGKDYIEVSKNVVAHKASARKLVAAPTASLSLKPSINRNVALKAKKNRSLKVGSPLKYQNRTQKTGKEKADIENVPEKTLHVILTETENSISESPEAADVVPSLAPQSFQSYESLSQPQSPSLSSHEEEVEGEEEGEEVEEEEGEEMEEEEEGELKDYDSVDDEDEVEDENESACEATGKLISNKNRMANHNNGKFVDGNPRKTAQKGVVRSESKGPTPVKLKFRRGKVVDIQSESNGPRRLRFRRGRAMEEHHDHKNETRRRNFKKSDPDGDGNGTNPSNEKVVLRHQDMQGRKDGQGLFNNVIEETASKLVESRKSKVKALVGAFETVISLQDTKPSPQTVS